LNLTQAMNAKTVVVTGAIRGIGFEIARQLAGHSAQVILTARKSEAGQAAINKLNGVRSVPHFHPQDVTNEESIEKLAAFISATYGKLDVLVNNAGIIPDSDTEVLSIDLSTIRTTLETNTLAPLRLAQVLAALLRKSGMGRVINISSGMGALSEMKPDHASYRMSKAALNAVTGM